MTDRERLLAILAGRPPDRIPWIPRLKIWYTAHKRAGTLPESFQDLSLDDVERCLRVGTPARDGCVFRSELQNVEIHRHQLSELEERIEYRTSVGTVTRLFRGSQSLRRKGIEDLEVEFMLKERQDYAVVQYLVEHRRIIPTYEQYEEYEEAIGDRGYPMVHCGDCPFHHWMRSMVGYEKAYFHLQDFPTEVENLLGIMLQKDREVLWNTIADSPARLILHGVHFSSQMTPPSVFAGYITPYYQELSALLRSRGQTLTLHADNDTRHILRHIEQAGFRMVECFATQPLVSTTLAEARAAWGDRVIIWGGVPSVILEEPYTDDQFETYMQSLFRTIAPGDAFILGVADNVMPEAKIERIQRITQMVEQRGDYPVTALSGG